ncbi:MAG: OFA family MFS transporter [Candidatus Latescibacterota bacterium]|jgi:OFA family oxalate/formate antiporter-like MFS transporter
MSHRWRIAAAAVTTHLCLGSVYAWSIFVPALQAQTGWSRPQLTWAFSLAIACLGLTAALAAPLVQRWGPRRTVTFSAVLFSAGLIIAGLAIHLGSRWLLYLGYGLVGGIGLGLGYVPPVTTLMRWFVDRKGFATGLAVGGFGLGALLASFLGEWLLRHSDCTRTFLLLGVGYGLVLLEAARFLRLPDEPAAPAPAKQGNPGLLVEPRFWLIWTIFFLNIATGILLIALARPMLEEAAVGLTQGAIPAVTAVAIMGLFNGLGRLGWSSLSDRLGRTSTWIGMFLVQTALFGLLWNTESPLVLAAGLWLIASCYGGGFALCPALVADTFGPARAPQIYGLTLTAWSAAALLSPPLAAGMRESCGSYTVTLGFCAAVSLVGLILVIALRRMPARREEPVDPAAVSLAVGGFSAGN